MAKMLDISTESAPNRWLNLDAVLLVKLANVQPPHVEVSTTPGGSGYLLPPHITLDQVLEAMQS